MSFLLYRCDPAHAVGSTDGPVIVQELQRTHLCPECHAEFSSEVELDEHLTTEHPVLQPHLLLGRTRVPGSWVVRQRVDPSTLQIINATEVRLSINGAPLHSTSSEAFRQVLAQTGDGVLELHVRNRDALQQYDIHIQVPEEAELQCIDDEFRAHLARADVTVSDVRRFDDALSVGAGARAYASALADYVYGVLAKDRAGQTTLPYAAFLDKLKRALAILGDFDRPLAAAVASCIRFNLNDFRSAWRPSGVQMLDRAFRFYRERTLGKTPDLVRRSTFQSEPEIPLCPVDTVTQTILNLLDASDFALSALLKVTSRHDLSAEDRVKVCVLLAERLPDLESRDTAACREALEFDPIFGQWANRTLRGLR